jgi:signal transduction histidine kinase
MTTRTEVERAQAEFAAAIVHEIRNPLSSILTAVELLLGGSVLTDRDRATLEAGIRRETQRLRDLLESILDFARPSMPRLEEGSLNRLVEEVASMVGDDRDLRGTSVVETSLDATLGETRFDPRQTKQVLWNVVQNGLQAMTSGGTLRIRTSRDGAGAVVSIEDSGPGIPLEDRARIFDPFYSTRKNGSGLGLSIARRLMEGHGGSITAESEPGRGARFVLRFPSAAAPGQGTQPDGSGRA